jgi:hypothetical protein
MPRTTYPILCTTYLIPRTSYLISCTTYHVHMPGMPTRAQATIFVSYSIGMREFLAVQGGIQPPAPHLTGGGLTSLAAVQYKRYVFTAKLIPYCIELVQGVSCSPHQHPFWQGGSDPTSYQYMYIFHPCLCPPSRPNSVPRTAYCISRISCLVSRTSCFVPHISYPALYTLRITPHTAPK